MPVREAATLSAAFTQGRFVKETEKSCGGEVKKQPGGPNPPAPFPEPLVPRWEGGAPMFVGFPPYGSDSDSERASRRSEKSPPSQRSVLGKGDGGLGQDYLRRRRSRNP